MSTPTQVLAFDVYGTLLDTGSISTALEKYLNIDQEKANALSSLWRRYQLEYTWRLNSMNIYEPFYEVTRKSFVHAASEFDILLQGGVETNVMEAYNNLPSFPAARTALQDLMLTDKIKVVVFSNGTQKMIESALRAGSIHEYHSGIYVADSVKKYKPAPEIYRHLLESVGKSRSPHECWLVSGNPFDVVGASAQGLRTICVDTNRNGWVDQLGGKPTHIIQSLDELQALIDSAQLQTTSFEKS